MTRVMILLWLGLLLWPVSAQQMPPVITAANIDDLAPVARIDFAETGLDTGWFVMNRTGTQLVAHSAHEIFVWTVDAEGQVSKPISYTTKSATLIAAAFAADDTLYGALQGPDLRLVKIGTTITPIRTLKGWSLVSLWADEDSLWAEAFSSDGQEVILHIPYDETKSLAILPYAPAQDIEAVVRIGRIAPPYTVTSTDAGRVTVWDLPTGKALLSVDTGTGEAAVFGALNTPATHLVWRDARSQALYWLDLKTGQNRVMDRLNGDYVQWFFLTPAADVIIGIDRGFSQHVNAWKVDQSGAMLDLGAYRSCTRPQPDMAALSADGTTLVMGCDTGLDIWRINVTYSPHLKAIHYPQVGEGLNMG